MQFKGRCWVRCMQVFVRRGMQATEVQYQYQCIQSESS